MTAELNSYLRTHQNLLLEQQNEIARHFHLRLPALPPGRELAWAKLELPKGFPESASAKIRLPPDAVLRIPHVGAEGDLCLGMGDPGPLSGVKDTDRINQLVDSFYDDFLEPWCAAKLDNDFIKEALNYWFIHCTRCASNYDAVRKIYTLNQNNGEPKIFEGTFLPRQHIVIAEEPALTHRFVVSIGQGQQVCNSLVADIPISYPLTPETWPTTQSELERLLRAQIGESRTRAFLQSKSRRNRLIHRLVILRAPQCSFGFLLVGGPPTIIYHQKSIRSHRT